MQHAESALQIVSIDSRPYQNYFCVIKLYLHAFVVHLERALAGFRRPSSLTTRYTVRPSGALRVAVPLRSTDGSLCQILSKHGTAPITFGNTFTYSWSNTGLNTGLQTIRGPTLPCWSALHACRLAKPTSLVAYVLLTVSVYVRVVPAGGHAVILTTAQLQVMPGYCPTPYLFQLQGARQLTGCMTPQPKRLPLCAKRYSRLSEPCRG